VKDHVMCQTDDKPGQERLQIQEELQFGMKEIKIEMGLQIGADIRDYKSRQER